SESRLPVGALRVEISEAAIAEGDDPKLSALSLLSEIGVRISIDDFGTGASSLRDLHRLPIDSLKIDEPFVRSLPKNVRGDRLFRTFLKVAESLGASAIAEGISTEEQLEELRRLGCVYGQGFLFSPALPAARYESILQRG